MRLPVSGTRRVYAAAARYPGLMRSLLIMALALGADAVSIGVASLIALGCNRQAWWDTGSDRWIEHPGRPDWS